VGREAENEPCCFDDWVDEYEKQIKKRETASPVTDALLEALRRAGIRNLTVLDIGCGIGDLAVAAIGHGAARADGFDLSSRAIERARRLADERGVGDRATFEVADGAEIDLPKADVVVLNRVICCYPDAEALVDRSLAAARRVYAFTAPRSKGVLAWWLRLKWALTDAMMHLRKKESAGFKSYIHDLDRVDGQVRSAGFRRIRHERRRIVWELAVYARG
jgi:magnesium-protoporphyrin O-methyltransferase